MQRLAVVIGICGLGVASHQVFSVHTAQLIRWESRYWWGRPGGVLRLAHGQFGLGVALCGCGEKCRWNEEHYISVRPRGVTSAFAGIRSSEAMYSERFFESADRMVDGEVLVTGFLVASAWGDGEILKERELVGTQQGRRSLT